MAKGEDAIPLDPSDDPRASSTFVPNAPLSPRKSPDPDPLYLTLTPDPSPRHATRRRTPSRPPYLRRTPKANKSTFLYRFYDEDDVLLYVGITDSLVDRTWSHARASTWMEFAVRSAIVSFTNRAEAEEHEVLAIRTESPLFNQAYNDDPNADGRIVDYLIEHDRRDLLAPAVSRG